MLQELAQVEVHLEQVQLWNFFIPVIVMVSGLLIGYLLTYFLCLQKNSRCQHDEADGPLIKIIHKIKSQTQYDRKLYHGYVPQVQKVCETIPRIRDLRHEIDRKREPPKRIAETPENLRRYDSIDRMSSISGRA